jgi:hypothetical protein
MPVLTLAECRKCINEMIESSDRISVCTFYGKLLYVDIDSDWLDSFNYDTHNGDNTAYTVINALKKEQLNTAILRFFTYR